MIKLSSPATQEFWEIPVLYEDEYLLVLNKPADLLTGPGTDFADRPSLISLLHKGVSESKSWATSRALSFLMYPQPLDTEASGVLVLAKTKAVLNKLSDLFGSEQPVLSFITLIQGSPTQNQFAVQAKLAADPVRAGLVRVDHKGGKRARSLFEVVERFSGWTLLRCVPLTWREHQIRAHLAYNRLPLAGDEPYRGKPLLLSSLKPDYHLKPKHIERPLIARPCLHAGDLRLNHPVTGQPWVVNAPWPKDLAVAVKYLRRYASVG